MSFQGEPKVFLWDARNAANTARRFVAGKTFEEFITDDLLRSAIERQLQIVGEALSQLARIEPSTAEKIPQLRQIVSFRFFS